jgi:hypothetical protein
MWDDQIKQVSGIEAAGGLNRSLILKSSGTGGPVYHLPEHTDLTSGGTLTPAELCSRFIAVAVGGAANVQLPAAADLAAYLNGGAASRNGTKLWVGATIDFSIQTVGASAVVTMTAGAMTGITINPAYAVVVDANTTALFSLRFTDVTVGAEEAELFPRAGTI